MTRLHPDDIQAIAERVVSLMRSDVQPKQEVSALTIAQYRMSAREELAKAQIRKQEKLEKKRRAA